MVMNIENVPEKLSYDYEFVKKIGEGANGETWLARHRFDQTQVAIKCLKTDKIKENKAFELFNRESELLKSVNLEGVPRFYDFYPVSKECNGYIVQEYIQAQSLQEMIDNGEKFTESEALDIAERIAGILYHLENDYQPPIIHRDIKPSNILYRKSDGLLYLIDFGSVANPQKRTRESTVAGTFGYMPPEQIIGHVEIQSDYYALGATLLHMLTGVPPYEFSYEVFFIDIKRALRDKGISLSYGMIELLSCLLNREVEKRPENSRQLLDMIRFARENKQSWKHIPSRFIQFVGSLWDKLISVFKIRINSFRQRRKFIDFKNDTIMSLQYLESKGSKASAWQFVTRNWIKCEGIARRYVTKNIIDKDSLDEFDKKICAIEYTFEAENKMWCGLCLATRSDDRKLPARCWVLYNPSDPRENALYCID